MQLWVKASGPNCVYVTEDFSRRVRKHREALLSYARELRDRFNKLIIIDKLIDLI